MRELQCDNRPPHPQIIHCFAELVHPKVQPTQLHLHKPSFATMWSCTLKRRSDSTAVVPRLRSQSDGLSQPRHGRYERPHYWVRMASTPYHDVWRGGRHLGGRGTVQWSARCPGTSPYRQVGQMVNTDAFCPLSRQRVHAIEQRPNRSTWFA